MFHLGSQRLRTEFGAAEFRKLIKPVSYGHHPLSDNDWLDETSAATGLMNNQGIPSCSSHELVYRDRLNVCIPQPVLDRANHKGTQDVSREAMAGPCS